jgi:hypothetical protein
MSWINLCLAVHAASVKKCVIHFIFKADIIMLNILQYKKEVKEMLGFAESYMLKASSPNKEDISLVQPDSMAADPDDMSDQ